MVGGGIIGASCAAHLAERGADVTVMDAGKPRFGTSLANAGHIVVSHSVPMAAPGMVGQGFRSLLSRDGAFAVSARPGRGTLGWLLGFARKCSQANVAALQPGMDQILHRSAQLLREDPEVAVTPTGLWQVFTSSTDRATAEAEHLRHYGVQVRDVPGDELRAEPGLTDHVCAAIELTEDFGVDPAALWLRMRRRSETAGALWQEDIRGGSARYRCRRSGARCRGVVAGYRAFPWRGSTHSCGEGLFGDHLTCGTHAQAPDAVNGSANSS